MFNKVILMGRLTRDPEMRTTQSGIPMCRFTIAVDRSYVKQGEERQADFFDITVWRQTAEFVCRWFSKGRPILVEGTLQNNNYTDNNGVKHYSTAIIADSVSFCGDKRSDNGGGYGNNGYPNNGGYGNNGYPNNGGYGNNGYPNNGGYGNNSYPNNGGYGNNGYSNNGGNYGNNGYGGNGGYPDNNFTPQQPAPQPASNQQSAPQPPPTQDFQSAPPSDNQKTVELGNIGDFQEIISDGDVPF